MRARLARVRGFSFLLFLAALAILFPACKSVPIDRSLSALEGRAATVVLHGFGARTQPGMLFIQIREGSDASGIIRLDVDPLIRCGDELDSCVRFQFWQPDGSQGFSGAVPKGRTGVSIPLSAVIQADTVRPEHDAEYALKAKVHFLDPDGREDSTIGTSFIRINVLHPDYQSLGCGDPMVAFRVPIDPHGCEVQYTTGFRSALCGECN